MYLAGHYKQEKVLTCTKIFFGQIFMFLRLMANCNCNLTQIDWKKLCIIINKHTFGIAYFQQSPLRVPILTIWKKPIKPFWSWCWITPDDFTP
jgi:hypothetical protein